MYNLGIATVVDDTTQTNWSMEQFYELDSALISHFDAIINMCVIKDSIQKYGKTAQLKDLVGASVEAAGITFSLEGLWQGIKDFFKWIWDKLKAMWNWFTGLFKSEKKKDDQAKAAIDEAAKKVASDGSGNQTVEIVNTASIMAVADKTFGILSSQKNTPPLTPKYIDSKSIEEVAALLEEKEKQKLNMDSAIEYFSKAASVGKEKITTTKNKAIAEARNILGTKVKLNTFMTVLSKQIVALKNGVAEFSAILKDDDTKDASKLAVAVKVYKQDYSRVSSLTKAERSAAKKCYEGLLSITDAV